MTALAPPSRTAPLTATLAVGLLLMATGCGTNDSQAAAPSPAPVAPTSGDEASNSPGEVSTPSAPASQIATDLVEVVVDGRTISGSCSGTSAEGAPTLIMSPGLGSPRTQLSSVGDALVTKVRVCSYDRAGTGSSDPAPAKQSLASVVDDMDAWLRGGSVEPPYVLLGQSLGGSAVMAYAQAHPDDVAGFVAMNPVPPYTSWLARASTVETPEELQTMEVDFYAGANDERLDLQDTDLMTSAELPSSMPFVVMFAEDCPGDFCDRIRPALLAEAQAVAATGAGGRLVTAERAGHEIFATDLDLVLGEVEALLQQ